MIYYNNLLKRLILSRFFYKTLPERVWIIVELREIIHVPKFLLALSSIAIYI